MTEKQIKLPIKELCEFLYKSGSLDSRFVGFDRAYKGAAIHRKLQKKGGDNYSAEVFLSEDIKIDEIVYTLSGRADGIIKNGGEVILEEIKTLSLPLDMLNESTYPSHSAQMYCYGYIYALQNGIDSLCLRLTYYNVDTDEIKAFEARKQRDELCAFVYSLIDRYKAWAKLKLALEENRTKALTELKFPFESYRKGQRQLAASVYRALRDKNRLFALAPTGVGKTISTLFPAMKAQGEGLCDKLFYLTAKTQTRTAATDAILLLRKNSKSFDYKSVVITAKDKICFLEERSCNPKDCPYADGYFDRVDKALFEILKSESFFDREKVEALAKKYTLCPYELSLDISNLCDLIICDYNYLFDPRAHLLRYFEQKKSDHAFLIDEAHNLAFRTSDMYSASLSKKEFFELKKQIKDKSTYLNKALAKINSVFIAYRKSFGEKKVISKAEIADELLKPLCAFNAAAERFLEKSGYSEVQNALLSVYFDSRFFLEIAESYSDSYVSLLYKYGDDVVIKYFCADPSDFIDEGLKKGRSAVLFSATLNPFPYYYSLYKTKDNPENDRSVFLDSPFDENNLAIFCNADISTKYSDRECTKNAVARLLITFASAKSGNYIFFFPSYKYLNDLYEIITAESQAFELLIQTPNLSEEERNEFLSRFEAQNGKTLIGFCVMGGVFGEGIDLVGERLIGCAVVGVGLSQINAENDAIKAHFDEKNGCGFDYAYTYPGMNRVLQSAGRVLRSESDKGALLLIDKRFATREYKKLFPPHWKNISYISSNDSLCEKLKKFWNA